MLNITWCIVGL